MIAAARVLAGLAILLAAGAASAAPPLPALEVAPGGHMLETADKKPFFWLADTAWELIHRATPDEQRFYLRTRARQGFTVIQTVVLAEQDGLRTPTPDGLLPFERGDPAHPSAAYFDRVAQMVDDAADAGLYVALLPSWGDKLTAPWGAGPRIFADARTARAYGRYLGARLQGRTNIVWMLGGDRPARLAGDPGGYATRAGWPADQDWTPIWAAMADGLAQSGPRLTLYHPQGGKKSTSQVLAGAGWLTVNGVQSGHGGGHDVPVWDLVARDYALGKPTIDLEPNYEDHPFDPWPRWDPATGYFRDHDVRKQIWRAVLAGAAGATYGHHAVWQWAGPGYEPINFPDRGWAQALDRPGALSMRPLRDLLLSRPYVSRIPDAALVKNNSDAGGLHLVAARGQAGDYAFIYFTEHDQTATIDLARLRPPVLRAWWYDPRDGAATLIGEVPGHVPHAFTSPPYGPDWVLVLDDPAAGFSAPGL